MLLKLLHLLFSLTQYNRCSVWNLVRGFPKKQRKKYSSSSFGPYSSFNSTMKDNVVRCEQTNQCEQAKKHFILSKNKKIKNNTKFVSTKIANQFCDGVCNDGNSRSRYHFIKENSNSWHIFDKPTREQYNTWRIYEIKWNASSGIAIRQNIYRHSKFFLFSIRFSAVYSIQKPSPSTTTHSKRRIFRIREKWKENETKYQPNQSASQPANTRHLVSCASNVIYAIFMFHTHTLTSVIESLYVGVSRWREKKRSKKKGNGRKGQQSEVERWANT